MPLDLNKSINNQFYDFSDTVQVTPSVLGDRIADVKSDAIIKGTYVLDGTNVYINSYINVDINFRCDKCLSDVFKTLNVRFDCTYFLPGGETLGDYTYSNYNIDFTEAVNEQLLLNMPSRIVCKKDCKGFCAICGWNLNESECSCEPEVAEIPNPFSILKGHFDN